MSRKPNVPNIEVYSVPDEIGVEAQWLYKLYPNGFSRYLIASNFTFSQWLKRFSELNPEAIVNNLTLSFLENGTDQSDAIANLFMNGYIFPIKNGYVLYYSMTALTEILFIAGDSKRLEGLKAMRGLMTSALIHNNYEPYSKEFLMTVAKLNIFQKENY